MKRSRVLLLLTIATLPAGLCPADPTAPNDEWFVTVVPNIVSVDQGQVFEVMVTAEATHNFETFVEFEFAGQIPPGTTFADPSCTGLLLNRHGTGNFGPASCTLRIQIDAAAPVGVYAMGVIGRFSRENAADQAPLRVTVGSPPPTGQVRVRTATTGVDLDPGYSATLGTDSRTIGPNSQATFTDLAPGGYSLGLSGIDPNCSLQSVVTPLGTLVGQNPIQIDVADDSDGLYTFQVDCVPNVAQVVVHNQTDGDPMVAAYKVTVTSGGQPETRDFPPGNNVFFDVTPGDIMVEVSDVPPHCFLVGNNPETVTVGVGESKTVSYRIDCTGNRWTLRVITRTTGTAIDPDGYLVNVADQTIGFSNEAEFSHDFTLLPAGDHEVTVFDVAPNCTLTPASPFTATVVADQVTPALFNIVCSSAGAVSVAVATTGDALDPDGYELTVGGESRSIPTNPAGDVLIEGLPAGQAVQVLLDDVAPNCTVAEANPQQVTVVQDAVTAAPGFSVTCVALGTLEVTTMTTGGNPPAGGFNVRVGTVNHPIGINETRAFPGLTAGDVEVTLLDGTENCTVAAPNPRTVNVVVDATTPTTFNVSCPAPTPPVIFESDRDGDFDIYAMNEDGTGVVPLTQNNGIDDLDPSWAWDNSRIVFVSMRGGQSDVWSMAPDGTDLIQITNNAAANEDPELSPDGKSIVYEQEDPNDGSLEIFIANADGTNPVQLTDATGISEAPHFHPDDPEILFKSDRDGDFEIYLMNVDGTNLRKLTETSVQDFDASWSPNGETIVFSSERAAPVREDLWVMDRDGMNPKQILFNAVWDWHPVFSTNGSRIIFTSDRDNDDELFIMNADGTVVTQLTFNTGADGDAEFKKPGG